LSTLGYGKRPSGREAACMDWVVVLC